MRDQFRSDLVIGAVRIPILVVHGEGDEVIPIQSAKRLFELANASKVFISVPCCDHEVLDRKDVFPRVFGWIDDNASPKRMPPRRRKSDSLTGLLVG